MSNASLPTSSDYTEENAEVYEISIAASGFHRRNGAEVGFEPQTLQLRISESLTAAMGSIQKERGTVIQHTLFQGSLLVSHLAFPLALAPSHTSE